MNGGALLIGVFRRESMQDQHRESQSTSRRYHDPRAMYKKHHWQVAGPTFYQVHQLYDKHWKEQSDLVDLLAERIQVLGGISVAMAPDIAETTQIPRFTRGSGGLQTTALGRAEWRCVRRARRLPIKHAATGAHCIRQRALDKPGIINARMASPDGSIKTFPLRGTLGGDLNGERLLPLLSLKGEQRHDEDIHGCLCGIAPLRRNDLG